MDPFIIAIFIVVAAFVLHFIFYFILFLLFLAWCFSLGDVFEKIGVERWKSYIPFYNVYIVIKAAGLSDYYVLGCLLPLLDSLGCIAFYAFIIYISVKLAVKFGKRKNFLVKTMILPPFYMYQLGKDNSEYNGDYKRKK